MKFNYKLLGASALLISLSACFDDNYDLSDVDTTVRVPVNNLVIPVNIDRIEMSSIIKIDEDDPGNNIHIVNGEYAYVKDGTFTANGVNVDKVTVAKPTVNPVKVDISMPSSLVGLPLVLPKVDVDVPGESTTFSFNASSISDDIYNLTAIYGEISAELVFEITGSTSFIASYDITDMKLQIPASLMVVETPEGSAYDAATGVLTLNRTGCTGKITLPVKARGIDTNGCFTEKDHSLKVEGTVGIISGHLTIYPVASGATVPANVGVMLTPAFSALTADSFDGKIKYDINDVSVPQIDITDLPDVLAQPNTNLILENPALYLQFNNPVSVCGLTAQSGFEITAFHGDNAKTYSIDNSYFTISSNNINNFCFAPTQPKNSDSGYPSPTFVPYKQLSYVLSGNGLPDRLDVNLPNFQIPLQEVKGFLLGHNYDRVEGKYKFIAPLQFKEGSVISYQDVMDGWSSETLDNVNITALDVNLKVSTDIPVAVNFTGYPIDVKGNRINNVSIEGAQINANANNQDLHIRISGAISGLDGIEFTATATTVDGNALSPDMHIILTDIRPCVSGYFQKEL